MSCVSKNEGSKMTWLDAVELARENAAAAKKSPNQEDHIPTLIKCILDLCDAVEDIGRHAKTPEIDDRPLSLHEEEGSYDQGLLRRNAPRQMPRNEF